MTKPKTKKQLLADPRVAKIGDPGIRCASDIMWQEDDGAFSDGLSWWLVLADGWVCDGTHTLHEPTIAALCDSIQYAEKE